MFNRILLLLALGVAPLAAQRASSTPPDTTISRLLRERDSVGDLWRRARDLVVLQDSLAHVASIGRLDTVTIGSIRIVTNRPDLPFRQAAEAYWPILDSLYGDDARQLYDRPVPIQVVKPPRKREKNAPKVEQWGQIVQEDVSVKDLSGMLRSMLRVRQPDSALRGWLPGEIYPSFFGDSIENSEAYISLVTSGYEIGRRCFAGDIPSCAIALRLDDGNDSMVAATIVTPAERRHRVDMMEGYFRRNRDLEGLAECRAGSDVACTELVRSVPPHMIPHPLATQARMLLLRMAIKAGGRDGYHRLMSDSTSPIGVRLARTAGMPLDTLVSRWHATVTASRPLPVSISLEGILAGLGWVVLLGYFGLRSSRWRMG
jgi:hypothetical protein